MRRCIKGWRTLIFNALAAIPVLLEVAAAMLSLPEWRGVIPEEWWPRYALGVALINAWLRVITTTPVGRGE